MSLRSIHWFRRDLRLHDNTALYHALQNSDEVLPIFIFDVNILNELPTRDRRVNFIYQQLTHLRKVLNELGSDLLICYGEPKAVVRKLVEEYSINSLYTNHDYEPYATMRDDAIRDLLASKNINFISYKDHVIFEKSEVVKEDGLPYTVFTPYSKKWKLKLALDGFKSFPTEEYFSSFIKMKFHETISMSEMGFEKIEMVFPTLQANDGIINHYHETRDFPGLQGTTQLGIHLRFGTISIRDLANNALARNEKFLNELIWRDFYQMILWHFPRVVNQSFKPAYDKINWRNHEQEFEAWCNGKTGYPIVDAGMRELNETGWMHNRVRMIVASFLTKHLLIDWRWGEAYFAKHLNDFELASNNGGWQWAAGSGVDAAPYFRVFNPYLQTIKFDKALKYVRKWIPELDSFDYPKPIVEHDLARNRCLEVYKFALQKEI
jgi:deoxyribodipyrimidine photo-lyase